MCQIPIRILKFLRFGSFKKRCEWQNTQGQLPCTSAGAADNSTPAVNPHNENPTLVALGKLTHTNPRATLSVE